MSERERLDALERRVAAVEQLAERAADRPRREMPLDEVHRAEALCYVAVYFAGGRTDKVELRVGADDPPTAVVGSLNTQNRINSYAGGVVRPGEYWIAASKQGEDSGVRCVLTPLL